MKTYIKKWIIMVWFVFIFLLGCYTHLYVKAENEELKKPSLIEIEKERLESDKILRIELKKKAEALRNEADLLEWQASYEVKPRIKCRESNIIGDLSLTCDTDFIDFLE